MSRYKGGVTTAIAYYDARRAPLKTGAMAKARAYVDERMRQEGAPESAFFGFDADGERVEDFADEEVLILEGMR